MNILQIDRTQAAKQLKYLGYEPGDNVYLRFFYHSSDPRKNSDNGRKENILNWERIEKCQTDGRGVYVVVNGAGGGHKDSEITKCCAIFCEWDDLPLTEQFEKWSELGFVEPTFTVCSGDKSMQPYWVFDEPIAPHQWRELQNLLIAVMEADKSNKNPSRVFRLAGGWHIKPDREPTKTEIVGESGNRYNFMDLQTRLVEILASRERHGNAVSLQVENLFTDLLTDMDTDMDTDKYGHGNTSTTLSGTAVSIQEKISPLIIGDPLILPSSSNSCTNSRTNSQNVPQKYKDITVPVPMAISLVCALGKSKKYLNGVTTLRNTSMLALARDLIGVQTEFVSLGQTTDEDAYTLFISACQHCSIGDWEQKEWETIWKNAVRANPKSSLSHYHADGLESCIKGEYWRHLKSLNPVKVDETPETPVRNRALESDDKMIQDYNRLTKFFGNRIRLNLLSKRIEVNGKVISLDRAKLQLAVRHGVLLRSCREDIQDILVELAEQNQYSPIEEYLRNLPKAKDTKILENLAERYFGISGAIYQTFVRKTLIGAVARALRPGCKLDTALILQGKQGYKKSSFFKTLAGDYFDDSLGAVSDKDERLKLHRAWFVEWSELESVFKRRDVSQTKAFLSSSVDAIRPPYCRDTQDFARSSIIVATTNKDEFLSDETGNRRFWIVPIKTRIDIELLKKERDAIWAAAVLAFDQSEEWWLEYDEELAAETLAEEFHTSDPWQEPIASYVENRPWVKISDLLLHLQVDLNRQERSHQMRIAGLLKVMGWAKDFIIQAGKRIRVWCCPDPDPSPFPEYGHGNTSTTLSGTAVSLPALTLSNQLPPSPAPISKDTAIGTRQHFDYAQWNCRVRTVPTISDQPQNLGEVDQRLIAKVDRAETFTPSDLQNQTEQVQLPDQPLTPKLSFFSKETDGILEKSAEMPKRKVLGNISEKVDRVAETKTERGMQSDQPQKTEVDQVDQKDEIGELVGFIQTAIETGDREFAQNIQGILKSACTNGVDRQQVWSALTEGEQVAFTALIRPEQDYAQRILKAIECGSEAVARSINLDLKREIASGTVIEEIEEMVAKILGQSFQDFKNLVATLIAPIDAEKIRDIALIFWNDYYPDRAQSLMTQMFGSRSPGTKYSQEIIYQWLETENELVRDRITHLFTLKNSSSL